MKRKWVQLPNLDRAQVLLILRCNAAAFDGNYFRAEVHRKTGWNTWPEADFLVRDLREQGQVAFAVVDSSILETALDDPRGAIVLETEMDRAQSPDGEDWGAPSWWWFRPTRAGRWTAIENLTEALVRGVQRVDGLGFRQVFALVNPRTYFLALAAAASECGLLDRWIHFRVPAHPRHLLEAARQIVPFVQAAAAGIRLPGGIYLIPNLLPPLQREMERYRDHLPARWRAWGAALNARTVERGWIILMQAAGVRGPEREAAAR